MKKQILYIPIIILAIYSCKVTRVTEENKIEHGALLDTLYGESIDNKIASCMINIIDIETNERIPFASIEISNNLYKKSYYTNLQGYILIPDIKEGVFDIKISYVGYETLFLKDIRIMNKKDLWLTAGLYAVLAVLDG